MCSYYLGASFVCLGKSLDEVAHLHCFVCGCIHFQAAVNDVWEEWLSGIHLELQPALFRNLWLAVPSAVASKIRTLLIVCQREFSGGACR